MGKVVLFLAGMVFLLIAGNAAAQGVELKSLRLLDEDDHSRVIFDLSSAAKRKIFILDNPKRLVVDLKNTSFASRIKQPPASHRLFKRIRNAKRNSSDWRIVFDLKQKVSSDSFELKPNQEYGHRLVLDLFGPKSLASAKQKPVKVPSPVAAKPKSAGPEKITQQKNAQPKKKVARRQQKNSKSKIVAKAKKQSVPSVEKPKVRVTAAAQPVGQFVVAIDAGHGGNDPGARGTRGTQEKMVVLNIAKKLDRMIAREPGMRPVMIRKGDYYVGLRKRLNIARKEKADIFVSIHADAFHKSNIRGSSVYTLSQRGASSEAARWLAARQNESYRVGGVALDDKDEMLAEVLLDLSQTATLDASADVASKVLRNLSKLGKVHRREVQSAGFVVLKSPDIPSILVETAFISNPSEEKNLKSSAYQTKLAKAIFEGIRDYYRLRAAPAMHMAARKHVIGPGETLSEIAKMYGVSTRRLQSVNTLPSTRIRVGQILDIPVDG